jgi:hypothetical protein
MIRRLILILIPLLVIPMMMACNGGLANGNLIGVVVYETSGEPVVNPALIVGRLHKSPLVPDQQVSGDAEGKFDLNAPGGYYTVQISSSAAGPFYTWPDSIYIEENKTSIVLLKLPDGF